MRLTIDIPDEMHRRLKAKANSEGSSMRELVLCSLDRELQFFKEKKGRKGRRMKLPIIRSKRPGTLNIDNEKIFQIIPFP